MSSLIVLAVLAPRAEAATYTLDFQVTGITVGSGEWNMAQDLVDAVNDNVVDVDFSLTSAPGTPWVKKDGVSTMSFTTDQAILSGFPALALRWTVNGVTECDVAVDAGITWSTSHVKTDSNVYGGWGRTLGTTLMHELGHCLKLGHVNTEYTIMGDDWDHVHANSNTLFFYLGEDAADKMVGKFDVNTDYEDVGVVHWRYAGNDDGDAYADHERTTVQSEFGDDLDSYTEDDGDNPVYIVRAGQVIRPQFTFENNGSTNSVDIDFSYRLSANDYITSSDEILYIPPTQTLSRDNVYTTTRLVTIPDDTTPGRHHIGARIDDLVNLTDDESPNNATYIDIDVLENGDLDFCKGPVPCERFQGDCDSDDECASGLSCIEDMGDFYGFEQTTDVCDYPQGDPAYCSEDEPCDRGLGDCDSDDECTGDLQCITDVGAEYGWASTVDVCGYPDGHAKFCSWAFPCDLGEGDCDSDLECATGHCSDNVGAAYGYSAATDVCELSFVLP
jgi:hypothetical protein